MTFFRPTPDSSICRCRHSGHPVPAVGYVRAAGTKTSAYCVLVPASLSSWVTFRSGLQLHPGPPPLAPLYPSPSPLLPMSLQVAWWQLLDVPGAPSCGSPTWLGLADSDCPWGASRSPPGQQSSIGFLAVLAHIGLRPCDPIVDHTRATV
jgi:hypothetical protein